MGGKSSLGGRRGIRMQGNAEAQEREKAKEENVTNDNSHIVQERRI